LLPDRACDEFLEAKAKLELSRSGIPDFADLSGCLSAITGWRVVAVAGLIPDDAFFDHLANRRFPAGAFIRPESELEYLEEPDVFHDVFGHVPLLANPVYARFLEAYGQGGQRALDRGQLHNLARLYWYTVEFGLMTTPNGLRIFGAGVMSSPAETIFSLEDTSPNRVAFDLERIMRTKYIIDDFQQTYFVIDGFERLLSDCYQDFEPLYDRLRSAPDLEAHELEPSDRIITKGDFHYFRAKGKAA
jgi:phenylalanine-4-hydroxylase